MVETRVPVSEIAPGEFVVRVGRVEVGARFVALEERAAGTGVRGPRGGAYSLTAAGAAGCRMLRTTKGTAALVPLDATAVVLRAAED